MSFQQMFILDHAYLFSASPCQVLEYSLKCGRQQLYQLWIYSSEEGENEQACCAMCYCHVGITQTWKERRLVVVVAGLIYSTWHGERVMSW